MPTTTKVNMYFLRKLIKERNMELKKIKSNRVPIEYIKSLVERNFGRIDNSRKKENVDRIFIFCHVAKASNYTVNEIGLFLNKDHSTIVNACKKSIQRYSIYKDYKKKVDLIAAIINVDIDGELNVSKLVIRNYYAKKNMVL